MKDLIHLIKVANFVYVCGNGGSATTAEHLTSDLLSKGIKAICLNSNMAVMTMIANDFGYEYIFSRQLLTFGDMNDLLITISCSGTSKNIVNAVTMAKLIGMDIYCFETFEKGDRNYEKLEDKHLKFAHKIKKFL